MALEKKPDKPQDFMINACTDQGINKSIPHIRTYIDRHFTIYKLNY